MGVLKEFHGILKGFLCGSYAISMLSLYLSIIFLWDSHWVSMIFRWGYSGISNESKLKAF